MGRAAHHKSPSEGIALRKCARTLAVPAPIRSIHHTPLYDIRRPPFVSPEPYSVCSLILASGRIWTRDSHSYRPPRSDRSESPLAALVADGTRRTDGAQRNATQLVQAASGTVPHLLPPNNIPGLLFRTRTPTEETNRVTDTVAVSAGRYTTRRGTATAAWIVHSTILWTYARQRVWCACASYVTCSGTVLIFLRKRLVCLRFVRDLHFSWGVRENVWCSSCRYE